MIDINIATKSIILSLSKCHAWQRIIYSQIAIIIFILAILVPDAYGVAISATSGGSNGVGHELLSPSMATGGELLASLSMNGAVLSPQVSTSGTGNLNEYHWVRDSTGKYAEVRATITGGSSISYRSSVLPTPGGSVGASNYVSAEEWVSAKSADYINCSALASQLDKSASAQIAVSSGSLSNYYNKAYVGSTSKGMNIYATQSGSAQGSGVLVTCKDVSGQTSHQLRLDASGDLNTPAKFAGSTAAYAGYNATMKITSASGKSVILEDARAKGTGVQRVDLHSTDGSLSRTAKSYDSGHIIQDIVGLAEVNDLIEVCAGTYKENVWVGKSVSLKGIGMPTVDGGSIGAPITLYANKITLEGFNVVNSKAGGIEVYSNNCVVRSNRAKSNPYGIYLHNGGYNTVYGNTASNNLYAGIYIDKSNGNTIASNDASFNSNGASKGSGICVDLSSGNTLSANTANDNLVDGINFYYANNNKVLGNTASRNQEGIYLLSSNYNVLDGNSVTSNLSPGMFIETSQGCTVSNNIVSNNGFTGLNLWKSSNNVLRGNLISGSKYNFDADGYNDIDTSNLINGKKIYYLIGKKDLIIDENSQAGTVYAINCSNITVKNLVISNNDCGILFRKTTNSSILNNKISDVMGGIFLDCAKSNIISGNTIRNTLEKGLFVGWSSDKNIISNNNIMYSKTSGIEVEESWCNTITGNTANYNQIYGIYLMSSGINKVTGNTFVGNKVGNIMVSGDSQWNTIKNNLVG